MNSAAPARIFAALLLAAAPVVALQVADPHSASAQTPNAERVETGLVESAGGDQLHYRIRLLPLASFPALPGAIVAQLSRRECMIPQTFEAQQPENVVHGEFRAPGSSDWAALCSASGSTTLYVFFAGQFDTPIALRSQPDSDWLGAEPGSSVFGSSWGIATLPASELRASPNLHQAATLDHDAIDDARLERSDTIRYFQAGKWLSLTSGAH